MIDMKAFAAGIILSSAFLFGLYFPGPEHSLPMIVECDTDSDCEEKNPDIEPY